MSRVLHGNFTIEREYRAPVARVFAAWADIETKARWFIGPPDRWKLLERKLDFRVGGEELLSGELTGGTLTRFVARYHVLVPNERLVYVYDMYVGSKHLSVSLATVELEATPDGTRMRFTEQAAFLDGEDGTRSREGGTAVHFDRLTSILADGKEIVSSRTFDAPPARLFAAFRDPGPLARWWGPKGFSSTFETFDFRPGGAWRFVMHGPDGTDYPNTNEFIELVEAERVVVRHHQPKHDFTLTVTLREAPGGRTYLVWRMRFDSEEAADQSRAIILEANEQLFDRLAAELR